MKKPFAVGSVVDLFDILLLGRYYVCVTDHRFNEMERMWGISAFGDHMFHSATEL
ncbi:MAG: hypothetical protein GY847_04805 [Proteobacteria bacterium]|nr:hypothetical protein [Pseudomonadota bacterium]